MTTPTRNTFSVRICSAIDPNRIPTIQETSSIAFRAQKNAGGTLSSGWYTLIYQTVQRRSPYSSQGEELNVWITSQTQKAEGKAKESEQLNQKRSGPRENRESQEDINIALLAQQVGGRAKNTEHFSQMFTVSLAKRPGSQDDLQASLQTQQVAQDDMKDEDFGESCFSDD